jgi:carbonic anhydrase/acetyltransferase-like protein (isoleucine patch superfamily)
LDHHRRELQRQDLCVVRTDPGQPVTIGSNCTVGHRVIVPGDNRRQLLVGMGSTLLNRSRIGNNCLVGANTLVTEGKNLPTGS